ncbi:MAG: DUF3786 domain-containing protein [Oscillospiraceae bacterium]|nr:DUF3786 domain-containing protein [Oscillospiraceae bacterium]
MKANTNQAFEQMNQVAREWLADRDPRDIAQKAGICYDADNQIFTFSSLGVDFTLTYPDYCITPKVGKWQYLLILHYLHLADGTALTGKEMPFSQMMAGMVRGGGIDRKCELAISSIKDLDEGKLEEIRKTVGGEKIRSNADVTYRIPFLPRFPVTLKIWLPDEEFPASGRLLVDRSADHYLTIEDAVTVAEILIEQISVPVGQRTFVTQS